jgi:hypothetical protein
MKLRLVFALAAAGLAAACMSQADTSAVEAAAAEFHQRQAQGEDAAIFEAASPGFRASARVEDLTRLNAVVRAVQGCNAPTRNPNIWNNNMNTSGHYISVVYNRTCAGGDLTENFVFVVNGNEALLYGYNVSGMALFPAAPTPASEPVAPEETPAAAPAPADTAAPSESTPAAPAN